MNSTEVVGYCHNGDFYCVGHLPYGVLAEDEDVSAVFAHSEWDSYPTCGFCDEPCLDVTITADGQKELAMELAKMDAREAFPIQDGPEYEADDDMEDE